MRARRFLVGLAGLALASACGPRSNEVDRFEQLSGGSGPTTGAGADTGSPSATSGMGPGSGGSGPSTGSSSLHGGSGGGATTGPGAGGSGTGGMGSGGGSSGPCCAPATDPGCTADSSLEQCVCGVDNYCCQHAWDAICVWIAQNDCQSCSSAGCFDMGDGEPNETEQSAHILTQQPISDCDSAGASFNGTIDGPNDVDWYRYDGNDTFTCVVNPTRTLYTIEGPLRLCKFAECKSGQTVVSCPSGTTAETSPGGLQGCCGSAGFAFDDIDCTGTNDEDATIYVRLDQPGSSPQVCNHYSLSYHY